MAVIRTASGKSLALLHCSTATARPFRRAGWRGRGGGAGTEGESARDEDTRMLTAANGAFERGGTPGLRCCPPSRPPSDGVSYLLITINRVFAPGLPSGCTWCGGETLVECFALSYRIKSLIVCSLGERCCTIPKCFQHL